MKYAARYEEGKIKTVETCTNRPIPPGFEEITKAEFEAFIASMPAPEPAEPDIGAEIDAIESLEDAKEFLRGRFV